MRATSGKAIARTATVGTGRIAGAPLQAYDRTVMTLACSDADDNSICRADADPMPGTADGWAARGIAIPRQESAAGVEIVVLASDRSRDN